MIAKITSSATLYSALAYNQNKADADHAKVIYTNKMIEPQNNIYDINICLRSFEPYLLANKRTEKPVFHVSLNPDPKDKLTDEQLSEIAQKYMQKMGYRNQPFIVYKHQDIERKHIHIVSLRVDENGKKINSNYEHRRSMTACRELEQQYGLVPADQKQSRDGLPLKSVKYENGDVKQQIANIIRPISKDYHFLSLKEYRALLTICNIGVEEIRGEIKGKGYKGLIYHALNDAGNKIGAPFKSSLLGKSVGIEALEKRIEKSAEIIKNKKLKERSKRLITAAMRTCQTRKDFEQTLQKQNISVIFRENEEGRIYGATFIDHSQKCVFNGSRLGKDFSANVFNDLFNESPDRLISPQSPTCPQSPQHPAQPFEPHQKSERIFEDNSNSGGIFDLFSPTGSSIGDDIAEQSFIRRTKKKKKRQQRM
jgi:hypothetical protein